MKVSHSIVINRPVGEVFDFVTTLTNERRWQPEIEEITITSPAPFGVGSTFREVRRTMGQRFEWLFEVFEFEPNRSIGIRTRSGRMPYSGYRYFEAVPGGTRVTEEGELRLTGLWRLFDPLLARLSQKPLVVAYARLKAILEAEPPA